MEIDMDMEMDMEMEMDMRNQSCQQTRTILVAEKGEEKKKRRLASPCS